MSAEGPCYRCLYPEPPPAHLAPSCAEAGLLGVLPGIIAVVQATEAIKIILGPCDPPIGRLLTYDSLKTRFRTLKLRNDKDCPVCGERPTIKDYIDYEGFCSRCARALTRTTSARLAAAEAFARAARAALALEFDRHETLAGNADRLDVELEPQESRAAASPAVGSASIQG